MTREISYIIAIIILVLIVILQRYTLTDVTPPKQSAHVSKSDTIDTVTSSVTSDKKSTTDTIDTIDTSSVTINSNVSSITIATISNNDNNKAIKTLSNNNNNKNNNKNIIVNGNNDLALYTFNFGVYHNESKLLSSRNYFLSHLRSVGSIQHTTIIYITNIIEEHIPYPSNFIIIELQWSDLIKRLESFLNRSFSNLMKESSYYKVCDFKPIVPALYPEIFEKYSYLGWIDNDLWLGSKLSALITTASIDNKKALISFLNPNHVKKSKAYSWGPISIFRGDFYRNDIMGMLRSKKIKDVMSQVFSIDINTNFAEWGCKDITEAALGWQHSFSRVLRDIFQKRKDLKIFYASNVYKIGLPSDYISCIKRPRGADCANCILSFDTNSSHLYAAKTFTPSKTDEVLICHFESGKKETKNLKKHNLSVKDILTSDVFKSSWNEGLQIYKSIDEWSRSSSSGSSSSSST